MDKLAFAKTINEYSLGVTAASIMTDCEHHGMMYGCTISCPVLKACHCELQDSDNKELYLDCLKEGVE